MPEISATKRTCRYRHCQVSLEGRRANAEFCSSTCRGKHSKQSTAGRERKRLSRLLKPATPESVEMFWDAVASREKRADALARGLARWCSA